MSKKRLIVSYSDVITNSSTQVFFLDIEEKLINLLNENNITDKVIIINSKEDVIRAVEFYQKEEDSGDTEIVRYSILLISFMSGMICILNMVKEINGKNLTMQVKPIERLLILFGH